MDLKNRQDEEVVVDDNARQEGAKDNEKGPHQQEQEERQAATEEEEEQHQQAGAEHARRLKSVLDSASNILSSDMPSLDVDRSLPPHTQEALAALYHAKIAEGKDGESLSGSARNKLLNQALAVLRPVFAAGNLLDYRDLAEDLEIVRDETVELRHEIRQRSLVEAHVGRGLGTFAVDNAEKAVSGVELSNVGKLAWELAQLGRKERKPADEDPDENPIVDALETMRRYAQAFGNIGARLAVIEARMAKTSPIWVKRRGIFDKRLNKNRILMRETVRQFLRSCSSDSGVPGDIGSHPVLRERFADYVKKFGDTDDTEEAVKAALDIVKTIDGCLDDRQKLLKAGGSGGADEPPKKKKGWFRR